MQVNGYWIGTALLRPALSAPAAAASQWETGDVNRDRKVAFDRSTAVREKGYAQAWERADFAELQPGQRTGEKLQVVKSLYRYDCIGRTAVPLLLAYYRSEGSELRVYPAAPGASDVPRAAGAPVSLAARS